MAKIGFVGFGEVNTPVDVIIRKCKAAEDASGGKKTPIGFNDHQ